MFTVCCIKDKECIFQLWLLCCPVDQERIAGAKLMVCLMSSEDPILECISGGLLEARDVLSSVSSSDPSIEVQQICQKMLHCLISSS